MFSRDKATNKDLDMKMTLELSNSLKCLWLIGLGFE